MRRRFPQAGRSASAALILGCLVTAGCTGLDGTAPPLKQAPANAIVVARGDTLYAISRRYGVPLRDLIEINGLAPPYLLLAGQSLLLPVPREYRVQTGDTLYGLSRQYNVDLSKLVRLNGLAPPYRLQAGQVLRLPLRPGTLPAGDPVVTVAAAPSASPVPIPPPLPAVRTAATSAPVTPPSRTPPARTPLSPAPTGQSSTVQTPASQTPSPAAPLPSPAAVPDGAPTVAPSPAPTAPPPVLPPPVAAKPPPVSSTPPNRQAAALPTPSVAPAQQLPRAGARFLWPVDGPILSGFGPTEGGLHNDGINIAAARGTPVRAADSGTVAYVGNELRGFGNLLLIRHADGWVTAYAHLDATAVTRGQTVERGQTVGTVGQTGGVRTPQLHFEIRRGSRALDPLDHLDAASPARTGDTGRRPGIPG